MMDAKRALQEGQFGKKAEQKYHWANPQKREMPKERRGNAKYVVKRRDLAHSLGQILH